MLHPPKPLGQVFLDDERSQQLFKTMDSIEGSISESVGSLPFLDASSSPRSMNR